MALNFPPQAKILMLSLFRDSQKCLNDSDLRLGRPKTTNIPETIQKPASKNCCNKYKGFPVKLPANELKVDKGYDL